MTTKSLEEMTISELLNLEIVNQVAIILSKTQAKEPEPPEEPVEPKPTTKLYLRAYELPGKNLLSGLLFTLSTSTWSKTGVYNGIDPLVFDVTEETTYTITAPAVDGYNFLEWSDDSIHIDRVFTVPKGEGPLSFNAFYEKLQ